MSEQTTQETPQGPRTVLVRVHEWSAWIPQQRDEASPMFLSSGMTAFEIEPHEKVLEVEVASTGTNRHFPITLGGETAQVRHGLYAFQAVMATTIAAPMSEVVKEEEVVKQEDGTHVVLPGHINREERRKAAKRNGKRK